MRTHSGDEKKLLNDIDETKDLHRDKWRHLERKKNKQKTKVRTHSEDKKKLMNDKDETRDLHRDKWRHLERKKNNTNKRLR